jgi:hypothetical protein
MQRATAIRSEKPNIAYPKRCVPCEKKPTRIQAHLVFADTQSQRLKNQKSLNFCQRSTETE